MIIHPRSGSNDLSIGINIYQSSMGNNQLLDKDLLHYSNSSMIEICLTMVEIGLSSCQNKLLRLMC